MGPALPKCRPALALSRQGEETKAAKGTTAGGLAAAPREGMRPECCPRASREVPASCPEQPGFRHTPGSPQTVPTGFAARSHEPAEPQHCPGGGYEGKGSRAGRASAGQAGTSPAQAPRGWELRDREPRGWARTEGASLQAGTRSPRPRPGAPPGSAGLRTCTARVCSGSPPREGPARGRPWKPPHATFEAFLVQHDGVVLGGLRQAEELAPEDKKKNPKPGAADPQIRRLPRGGGSWSGTGYRRRRRRMGRKAGTCSAGAERAA